MPVHWFAPRFPKDGGAAPIEGKTLRVIRDGVTFGDLLTAHRAAARLTQEELAERATLSVEAVSALERGVRQRPRRDTVFRLAVALELSEPETSALLAAARARDPRLGGDRAVADATSRQQRDTSSASSAATHARSSPETRARAVLAILAWTAGKRSAIPIVLPAGIVAVGLMLLFLSGHIGGRPTAGAPRIKARVWIKGGPAPGRFREPFGVAVDRRGNVYVSDLRRDIIQKLSAGGEPLSEWGGRGTGSGRFQVLADVSVDARGNSYVADSGNSRIQVWSSAGRFLFDWGSPGSAAGQFEGLDGVAIDRHGNIYVADGGNGRIVELSPSGAWLGAWGHAGLGPDGLSSPTSVAIDRQGYLYVTDAGHARVVKFFLGARRTTLASRARWTRTGSLTSAMRSPTGVAVDSHGNLYVADGLYGGSAYKFTFQGTLAAGWGIAASPQSPSQYADIAVDRSGDVYLVDQLNNRIVRRTRTGATDPAWALQERFVGPSAVAVDGSGEVYVADTGNDRIVKLSSGGSEQAEWSMAGTVQGAPALPVGVAVDASGNIYVVDNRSKLIEKLSPTGQILARWGSTGTRPGQFDVPSHITVGPDGNIFVADTGNNRIVELSPTGKPLAAWGNQGSGVAQFRLPGGVAADGRGDVYVADTGNDRIVKLTPSR